MAASARCAHGGRGGGAVRSHVRAGWALVTDEGFSGGWVSVVKSGGNGFHHRDTLEDPREQEERR